jgi:hypothetical protein
MKKRNREEFVQHKEGTGCVGTGTVLEFLRGRTDAVVFGAQAVNAYVTEP